MTYSTKPRDSISSEARGRLFSASGRPTAVKRALGLADDRKYSDLSSTESLTYGRNQRVQITDQFRGEIKHIEATNRTHNFRNDRIVVVANQIPFYVFSNIPFSKNSKNTAR